MLANSQILKLKWNTYKYVRSSLSEVTHWFVKTQHFGLYRLLFWWVQGAYHAPLQ